MRNLCFLIECDRHAESIDVPNKTRDCQRQTVVMRGGKHLPASGHSTIISIIDTSIQWKPVRLMSIDRNATAFASPCDRGVFIHSLARPYFLICISSWICMQYKKSISSCMHCTVLSRIQTKLCAEFCVLTHMMCMAFNWIRLRELGLSLPQRGPLSFPNDTNGDLAKGQRVQHPDYTTSTAE